MTEEPTLFSMAIWTLKEGREEEFMEDWTSFAGWTNEHQRGAMGVYLARERSDPHALVTFGAWESDDDLLRWRNTAEFKEFFERARNYCSKIEPMTLDTVATIGGPKIVSSLR